MVKLIVGVIWLALFIFCGALSAGIAGHKGRNATLYFFLGFFLGLIGLIISALVPRIDNKMDLLEHGINVTFLKTSSEITRGKLSIINNSLLFTDSHGQNKFPIPLYSVQGIELLAGNSLPPEFPMRARMRGSSRTILGVAYLAADGKTYKAYFSGMKNRIPALASQLEPHSSAIQS